MLRHYQKSIFFVLVLASLLLYGRSLNVPFVSDDWHWLSIAAERGSVVPDLTTNYAGERSGGSYNPVASLWINALYASFGLNPVPYRVASSILHGVVSWLLGVFLVLFLRATNPNIAEGRVTIAGMLASILFLVWPTHVEAVVWLASVPHVLATFWYLLALIGYLRWRSHPSSWWLLSSLVAACLAFLSKESAITIPLAVLVLELSLKKYRRRLPALQCIGVLLAYGILAALFLITRANATGLWFGSYAEGRFIVRPEVWIHTAYAFFLEYSAFGLARAPWSLAYFSYPLLVGTLATAVIIVVVWLLKRFDRMIVPFIPLFLVTMLPFIPLGFNRTSSDGERYTYLTSIFFLSYLAWLLTHIRSRSAQRVAILFVLLVSVALTSIKSGIWVQAGDTGDRLIARVHEIVSQHPDREHVILLAPDVLSGAHVFRNNIAQAYAMRHPAAPARIVQMPLYLIQTRNDDPGKLITWTRDERGFFIDVISGRQRITGRDRAENDRLTYELWGYDYRRFTSSKLRLLLTKQFQERLTGGSAELLVWNGRDIESLQ